MGPLFKADIKVYAAQAIQWATYCIWKLELGRQMQKAP